MAQVFVERLEHETKDFDIPSIKRSIIRYFYYCSRDKPEDPAAPPEHAVTAAAHLKTLEQKDPKTVRNVRRFLVD